MGNKIKILYYGLGSHLGGIETYLKKVVTNIDKGEFQCDFLVDQDSEPCFYKELTDMGCKFYTTVSRRKNYLQNRRQIKRIIDENRFDIVHCNLNSLSYIAICEIAIDCGCKVLAHSHNAGCLSGFHSRLLHRLNYRVLQKKAVFRVAVSELAGKWMFGDQLFTVINNGVDIDVFRYNESFRKEIRAKYNIEDDVKIILHVGAFRKQKNHDLLIDIFSRYCVRNPNSVLFLVGVGELLSRIKKKCACKKLDDCVIFCGNANDIEKYYSAADVFLFPSFYEGFPNALIEAQTAGLYSVVSDTITKQCLMPGISTAVKLDSDLDLWANRIEYGVNFDLRRENGATQVDSCGLGVRKEIEKLSSLYKDMIR